MLNAVLLRDNLIYDAVAGLHSDFCLAGFRCFDLEAVDNRIIASFLFLVAAEGVVEFTGSLRIVIIDLRCCRIGFAFILANIRNAGEIKSHLETCGTLVVLNGPVNGDILTRSCSIRVHTILCPVIGVRIGLAVRNEIVNNRICRRIGFHLRRRC